MLKDGPSVECSKKTDNLKSTLTYLDFSVFILADQEAADAMSGYCIAQQVETNLSLD